ncbi:unnamed protein product [[Candida] boidinii]|nr:unnamed protein product [[Candida] boidinii]
MSEHAKHVESARHVTASAKLTPAQRNPQPTASSPQHQTTAQPVKYPANLSNLVACDPTRFTVAHCVSPYFPVCWPRVPMHLRVSTVAPNLTSRRAKKGGTVRTSVIPRPAAGQLTASQHSGSSNSQKAGDKPYGVKTRNYG